MILIYKRHIYKKFFGCFGKVLMVFAAISLIMNLFEEISFFKGNQSEIIMPIFLTMLNLPSVLFELFPFIFLITAIYFFIEMIEMEEINTFKLFGITNLKLIQILSYVSFLTGIFIIVIFYNLSTNLKFVYLEIKNQYAKDDKYLAAVTTNGLWIRDSFENGIKFINAEKIEGERLLNISISELDKNFNIKRTITAKSANIINKEWVLNQVVINSKNNSKKIDNFLMISNFDLKTILTIFDNLSSLSLMELETRKKDYELLGYSTNTIDGYKHKIYSYPIYITLMAMIGAILMLNIKHNKSKIFHIIIGILVSVIIYYINYFFNVVIETQNVPYIFSIWVPQLILAMIIVISLIRLNEK